VLLPTPQMSDALVNTLTTIEITLFLQTLRSTGVEAGNDN
jgi:hypothetical protein